MVTTLTTFPPLPHKELRYQRRETFRQLPHVGKNPPKCGKTRRLGRIDLVKTGQSAWFKGLVSCAQVWACPVCAYRVGSYRAKELMKIMELHRAKGGDVYLATLTLPHDCGDELKKLRRSVSAAWTKMITGREWEQIKKRIAYAGYVRALEVTHGPNGWHPHLHVLIFTDLSLTSPVLDSLEFFLYRRWSFYVVKFGYRPPHLDHGVKLSLGDAAGQYVTKICKQGLAAEATLGFLKNSRQGYRTILEILDDYRKDPQERDKKLLIAWIKSMYGARQLTWGGDIRSRFKDLQELTDSELIEKEDGAASSVACFSAELWDTFFKNDARLRWKLIAILERSGPDFVIDLVQRILPPPKFGEFLNMQRFLNA